MNKDTENPVRFKKEVVSQFQVIRIYRRNVMLNLIQHLVLLYPETRKESFGQVRSDVYSKLGHYQIRSFVLSWILGRQKKILA
jgi:hypothetical protein